jgi:hypothetical protein
MTKKQHQLLTLSEYKELCNVKEGESITTKTINAFIISKGYEIVSSKSSNILRKLVELEYFEKDEEDTRDENNRVLFHYIRTNKEFNITQSDIHFKNRPFKSKEVDTSLSTLQNIFGKHTTSF